MSLAAESPLQSSSSSDDFAAFLDAELDADSSNSSPNDETNDDEEIDFQEERYSSSSSMLACYILHKIVPQFRIVCLNCFLIHMPVS